LSRKADIAERIRQMQGTAPPSEQQLQLQQFQMESQIRSTQLEIAKLEAEVTRLQTEAALNVAKTQSAEADPQLKVVEMQSKLQQKREELDLRERLSAMTNDMRKNQADAAIASKIAVAAMKPTGGKN
jgi:predicted RNase H-like nuclease (RuvC/YqgF family)